MIVPGWDLDVPDAARTEVPDAEAGAAVVDAATPPIDGADVDPDDEVPGRSPVGGDLGGGDGVTTTAATITESPRPDNVAITEADAHHEVAEPASEASGGSGRSAPPTATGATTSKSGAGRADDHADGQPDDGAAPQLLTLGRAAMLSAGVLAVLAVRRRNQLRRARPRARLPEPVHEVSQTERTLRALDPGERFARVDIAIRAVATALINRGRRVVAITIDPDGAVELVASGDVVLDAPWHGSGERWHLAAATPLELLADESRRVGAPTPTLVQLGTDDGGRDVYVDLEALEAIEIGGPGHVADAIVAAVATTLAGSVLAEVTTLIGLGVPDEAFLGHRLHVPVRDASHAFEAAADAIGSTASMSRSTFELRARVTSGEAWEPAVVLVGSAVGTIGPPATRTGLAVVSASPIQGPSSRLVPDGDEWVLLPAGIRLTPVGLDADQLASIAALVDVPQPTATAPDRRFIDVDDTILTGGDGGSDRVGEGAGSTFFYRLVCLDIEVDFTTPLVGAVLQVGGGGGA
jgi:hypothetical protein